ncbi:MAG: VWA domain-containing protein, partial [Pirellulales bacterium]|nr:VWA domain-containing protein [Pirellulales bacterium]
MSKQSLFRLALLSAAMMAVAAGATGAGGAEPGSDAARLQTYVQADGGKFFAASLKPTATVLPAAAHDIVVLIDTSASQTGEFRSRAISALNGLLAKLAPQDRVHLIAADIYAVGMTQGFAAPNSPEMAAALQKLDARVPLGATDMDKALTTAAGSFRGDSANPRALVYIGDGMSSANLLGTERFEQLTGLMTDSRIAVSAYAVGPKTDAHLLSALAGRTGGVFFEASADEAGAALAAAAEGIVFWPTSIQWPPEFKEVYPKRPSPLRADRDTVFVGTLAGDGPLAVRMTADTSAGRQTMQWKIAPANPAESNAYLVQVLDHARRDGGVTLPLTGTASLVALQDAVTVGSLNMTELAAQAVKTGDLEAAKKLAQGAIQQDPGNAEAKTVLRLAAQVAPGPAEQVPPPPAADLNLVGPPAPAAAADAPKNIGRNGQADPFAAQGAFVGAIERERQVIAQMITADVQATINQARGIMSTQP